jgi:hypothetical protein
MALRRKVMMLALDIGIGRLIGMRDPLIPTDGWWKTLLTELRAGKLIHNSKCKGIERYKAHLPSYSLPSGRGHGKGNGGARILLCH